MQTKENSLDRVVEFDLSHDDTKHWIQSSPRRNDLLYFHENTLHAFDVRGENCPGDETEKDCGYME